jgi:putative IMPACT (imprinted ancient) family translation regulator
VQSFGKNWLIFSKFQKQKRDKQTLFVFTKFQNKNTTSRHYLLQIPEQKRNEQRLFVTNYKTETQQATIVCYKLQNRNATSKHHFRRIPFSHN